jgi:nicotinate phosphoribosyltransferase
MIPDDSLLLTDLYQLSMLQAYDEGGMRASASFEFFVRKLPPSRGFLMAAGLAQVVDFLEGLRFTPEDLDYLRRSGRFTPSFVDTLAGLRFTGDVDAMPEGTVFFPEEPVIRVTAPLPEAQLVETRLINLIHFETIVASKAARMVLAAPGKQLIDFGLRRAHGAEAGLLAARASYLAGFDGTATILAEPRFGIPIYGTMAHSFIQVHDDETTAFEHFARVRPAGLTLLIDTYDTERAAETITRLAPRLRAAGITVQAVRLDSGDLAAHARQVRAILDDADLHAIRIFASGGLDEDQLHRFSRDQVPIDGYGVGTSLTTSQDAPALDCAYKLQEFAGVPRRKRSEGKATWPGRKQVLRQFDANGTMCGDGVMLVGEVDHGEPLLRPAMRGGRRVADFPSLTASRAWAAESLIRLPEPLRRLEPMRYPVAISAGLQSLAAQLDECERGR